MAITFQEYYVDDFIEPTLISSWAPKIWGFCPETGAFVERLKGGCIVYDVEKEDYYLVTDHRLKDTYGCVLTPYLIDARRMLHTRYLAPDECYRKIKMQYNLGYGGYYNCDQKVMFLYGNYAGYMHDSKGERIVPKKEFIREVNNFTHRFSGYTHMARIMGCHVLNHMKLPTKLSTKPKG